MQHRKKVFASIFAAFLTSFIPLADAATRAPEAPMQHNMHDAYAMGVIFMTAADTINAYGFLGDTDHRDGAAAGHPARPSQAIAHSAYVTLGGDAKGARMGDPLK